NIYRGFTHYKYYRANNKKKKCLIDIKHFFLCLPLSKKMIIDIIVNKNPDRFCMIEKVKKTMAENR
ncbi:TPA: hypothetical protein ACL38O_001435, partial [Streptococcus pneumoniae]